MSNAKLPHPNEQFVAGGGGGGNATKQGSQEQGQIRFSLQRFIRSTKKQEHFAIMNYKKISSSSSSSSSPWLVNEDQDGSSPRRLQTGSWLTKPKRDKQARSQRLLLKAWSRFDGIVLGLLLLRLLSLRVVLQLFSKEETTCLIVRHRTSQF